MVKARGREFVLPGTLLACVLLAWCPSAFALNPSLDVSQYGHTSWMIRDGFAKGQIISIAQTPDGYLWLEGVGCPLRRVQEVNPAAASRSSSTESQPSRRATGLSDRPPKGSELEGRQVTQYAELED